MRTELITILLGSLLVRPSWAQTCVKEGSPYGINAHAPEGASVSVLLNQVRACGIDWMRVDFVWAWVETGQDSLNWTRHDDIAFAAQARNLAIYATIGHNPSGTTAGNVWRFTTIRPPGEFDMDGDVDQTDFGHIQACFSGSSQPHCSACGDADSDDDGDVDPADLDRFCQCMGGADQPPPC